jgi:hypothetical protein
MAAASTACVSAMKMPLVRRPWNDEHGRHPGCQVGRSFGFAATKLGVTTPLHPSAEQTLAAPPD